MENVYSCCYYYGHICQRLLEPEQLLAEVAFSVDHQAAFID